MGQRIPMPSDLCPDLRHRGLLPLHARQYKRQPWTSTVHGKKFSKYLPLIINHLRKTRPPTFIIRLRWGRRCGAALISPRQPAQRGERTVFPLFPQASVLRPLSPDLFQIFSGRPVARGQTARPRAGVAASRPSAALFSEFCFPNFSVWRFKKEQRPPPKSW